jgi:serine/threonine protein kinase
VVIKILRADTTASPERKRRFVQEAKAASALNHPNIVHIYDISSSGGTDYIAMDYVAGKTLAQLIGKSGLVLSDTLKYAVQVADALEVLFTADPPVTAARIAILSCLKKKTGERDTSFPGDVRANSRSS